YFFKENCSYHLLSLLEFADPSWHLTDRFLFWTVPTDTVRIIAEQPGLVGDIAYRPSRSTQIRRKREVLSEAEKRWMDRITQDASLVRSDEFMHLLPERQAFVLDVTSDYLRYRSVTDEANAPSYKERNRMVLTARSGLRVQPEEFRITPFAAAPEQGHKTSRASLGAGWRNGELFEELTVRAGYHDLLDPEIGYTPDAQIELLALSLRHYEQRDHTRLERFTLANIVSLSPMDSLFKSLSWKINAGMQTVRHFRDGGECRFCSNGAINGGIGAAVESRFLNREVYFAFAEAESNVSHAYEHNHRVGGGGTVGLLADLTERWKILLSTTYLRFPLGERSDDVRLFFGQRYTLHKDLTLRFEFNHRDRDNDALFAVQAFF
ncbi:MAG: DUF4105 domain-containing protein, partial [Nitrospirae bacterium]|nr:DUF4105 domain-containing protein [Nitrospirota bacterium]